MGTGLGTGAVLGCQLSVLGTQYSVLSTQCSVLGTRYSVLRLRSFVIPTMRFQRRGGICCLLVGETSRFLVALLLGMTRLWGIGQRQRAKQNGRGIFSAPVLPGGFKTLAVSNRARSGIFDVNHRSGDSNPRHARDIHAHSWASDFRNLNYNGVEIGLHQADARQPGLHLSFDPGAVGL